MTSLQKPISRAVEKRQKRSMKLQIERVVYRAVDQRDQSAAASAAPGAARVRPRCSTGRIGITSSSARPAARRRRPTSGSGLVCIVQPEGAAK
jgi:hypothetical protein